MKNESHIPHLLVVLCILIATFTSCKKNPTEPITPPDTRPLLAVTDFARINLAMVDYDVVHITHQLGLDLRSSTVSGIGIGSKGNTGFQQYVFSPDTFDSGARTFIIHFDFRVLMDRSQIVTPLTIRYYSPDSTFIDVDTSIALYKYPYANAEIIADKSVLPDSEPFQDVARSGSKLYFHPIGPWGLFVYDLNTKSVHDLADYTAGDYIAADSGYVFYETANASVLRYNSLTSSNDLQISTGYMEGIAVFDHYIYVADDVGYYLRKYTLDGAFVDSVSYPLRYSQYLSSTYLTIFDSTAFSVFTYSIDRPSEIVRFDLRTKQFLPAILSPAFQSEGIAFFGDTLYYCDYGKKYVGAIPFTDLVTVSAKTQ